MVGVINGRCIIIFNRNETAETAENAKHRNKSSHHPLRLIFESTVGLRHTSLQLTINRLLFSHLTSVLRHLSPFYQLPTINYQLSLINISLIDGKAFSTEEQP